LGPWMVANLSLLHVGMGIFFASVTLEETPSQANAPRAL
jgi:hypothetical protein